MKRLLLVALALAACSGKGKTSSTTNTSGNTGSAPPPVLAKKISVSWGIAPLPQDLSDIYLETTDETGKQVSHSIGAYKGDCKPFKPAKEMNAVTGVACTNPGGTGTEIHAVVQNGEEIIILQMGLKPGVEPDPMSREQIKTIKVPLGIAIEVTE